MLTVLHCFVGCIFEVWPAPGAREGFQKCGGAKPPTFWKVFPGPRGRPDLKNAPNKNPARLPSSTEVFVAGFWKVFYIAN